MDKVRSKVAMQFSGYPATGPPLCALMIGAFPGAQASNSCSSAAVATERSGNSEVTGACPLHPITPNNKK